MNKEVNLYKLHKGDICSVEKTNSYKIGENSAGYYQRKILTGVITAIILVASYCFFSRDSQFGKDGVLLFMFFVSPLLVTSAIGIAYCMVPILLKMTDSEYNRIIKLGFDTRYPDTLSNIPKASLEYVGEELRDGQTLYFYEMECKTYKELISEHYSAVLEG